ncbi:MAG: acyltransferase domain-containing protein [Eubacteriales bacterium]|nr:acyltransferase domain-containing protein [Eubacteriales bacterium]
MLDYIDFLGLDEDLKVKTLNTADKNKNKIVSLAEKYAKGDNKCLVNQNDLTRLAVVIEALKFTKEQYDALGIDEKIFFDTASDIAIWCENNKNRGLKNYNWLRNHIRCELFRIGRLQFQLYKCNNPTLKYSRLPFDYGENLIYVHIPQGEKLLLDDCIKSLIDAKAFFEKYFPSYSFNYFFCESWLLFGGNKNFMRADSNIIKFSQLFDVAYSLDIDAQAIERIFGKRHLIKSKYPENTTLQSSAKKYIMTGGKLGIGVGTINKNKITDCSGNN